MCPMWKYLCWSLNCFASKLTKKSGNSLFPKLLPEFLWHRWASQYMTDRSSLLLNKKRANLILKLILNLISLYWSSKLLTLFMVCGGGFYYFHFTFMMLHFAPNFPEGEDQNSPSQKYFETLENIGSNKRAIINPQNKHVFRVLLCWTIPISAVWLGHLEVKRPKQRNQGP